MYQIDEVNRHGFNHLDMKTLNALISQLSCERISPWVQKGNYLMDVVDNAFKLSRFVKLRGVVVPTVLSMIIEYKSEDLSELADQLLELLYTYNATLDEYQFAHRICDQLSADGVIPIDRDDYSLDVSYSSVRIIEALDGITGQKINPVIPADLFFSLPYMKQTTLVKQFRGTLTCGILSKKLDYKANVVNVVKFLILLNEVNDYRRDVVKEVSKAYTLIADIFDCDMSYDALATVFRRYANNTNRVFKAIYGGNTSGQN